MSKKLNDKIKSQHLIRLYDKYKLLALNMFKWENLPETVESRHIERALYETGKALFYDHKDFGLICLPCMYSNNYNIYGEANTYIVNGFGMSELIQRGNDNQIILNNDLGIGNAHIVDYYAKAMYEVEKAINANVKQQKFPFFIETNKENELSMKRMFQQVEDGEPVIYGNKSLEMGEKISVLNLSAPYVADKLNAYKYELEREILTTFGLNNTFEKKERLLVDEIHSNNDFISRNVDIMYNNRLYACEQINKKFNLNITVVKNNSILNEIIDEDNYVDDEENNTINLNKEGDE